MNRRWVEFGGVYKLLFCPYGDDIEYAAITQNKEGEWVIVSQPLNIEYDTLDACTADEAKEEVEDRIREVLNDEVSYYEDLLRLFEK